jgi:hypothetical protein
MRLSEQEGKKENQTQP